MATRKSSSKPVKSAKRARKAQRPGKSLETVKALKSSASLFNATCTGTHIKEATITH
ncbi:MAG: hypothetical protein WB987_18540 [Candidatus Acidiferrales bacterium]